MSDPCPSFQQQIEELVTGDLQGEQLRELQEHVERCSACSKYLNDLRADEQLLLAYCDSIRPSISRMEHTVIEAIERGGTGEAPEAGWKDIAAPSVARVENRVTEAIRGEATKSRRRLTITRIPRIAAGVLIFAGIAGTLVYLIVRNGVPPVATVTFAQTREAIRTARTLTWHTEMSRTIPTPEGEMREFTVHVDCFYKEPGLQRTESTMSAMGKAIRSINITDFSSEDGRMINLTLEWKMAVTFEFGNLPEEMRRKKGKYFNYIAKLRELIEGSDRTLGKREIDGRIAHGFRVTNMGDEMDVWIDPETKLPLLMEGELPGLGKITMTDFAFDVELDEKLFDLTVPDGYTERKVVIPEGGEVTEDHLIEGLRLLASHNNNAFPPAPKATSEIMKNIMEKAEQELKGKRLSKEEQRELALELGLDFGVKLTRMAIFVQVKVGETWRYAGGGVELGDAETPVCWYRPEDSATYRVVYGDLHVEDVREEDLPENPEKATGPE